MASVQLRFTALPEHVRTARLVAVAVARRLELTDDALEGVRLAVGEACARAVQRSGGLEQPATVHVDLDDAGGRLVVEVADEADAGAAPDDDLSLVLVAGLAHTVKVEPGPGGEGGRVRMEWQPAG